MHLPKPFKTKKEFVKYSEVHSQTPEAAFSMEYVNYLYELAEEPVNFSSHNISVALPSTNRISMVLPYDCLSMVLHYDNPATRKLLDKASKNISEKAKRKNGKRGSDDNVGRSLDGRL